MNRLLLELPEGVKPEELVAQKDGLVHIRVGGTGKADVKCVLVPADDWQQKIVLAEQVLAEDEKWSEMGAALRRYRDRVGKLLDDAEITGRHLHAREVKDQIELAMIVQWLKEYVSSDVLTAFGGDGQG